MLRFSLLLVPLGLLGCDRPLLGHWEANDDKIELDFEDNDTGESDYKGDGNVYLCLESDQSECRYCTFEFLAHFKGEERWELEGNFVGKCKSFGKFTKGFECTLETDDVLVCELPGGREVTYVREF